MHDEVIDRADEMVALPEGLADRVAVDVGAQIAYVEHSYASNTIFLSWIARNAQNNRRLKVEPRSFEDVAKMLGRGMRLGTESAGDVDMTVLKDAERLICMAAAYRASDIHLMMRGTHCVVQIEMNGGLREMEQMSHAAGLALARAIYQGLATVRDASYKALECQNAQIAGEVFPPETELSSVRIVRGPCYPQAKGGEFMTLRLQYVNAFSSADGTAELRALTLPQRPDGKMTLVGYTSGNLEKLQRLMDAPTGVVIWLGPTGAGKTTAMYEVLQELARRKPQNRVVTIEDPVEYPMDWAVQMFVTNARNDEETGAAYAALLRVALRMAPKSILLGELRGPDVAVAACEAAVTGHQVLTTLHATDPFLFVDRLELMDSERLNRRVFCDHKVIRGVIAQRLLPRLCRRCSIKLTPDNISMLPGRLYRALQTWGSLDKVRLLGPGCEHCNHSGTVDRFAVAEVVPTDARLMGDFIRNGTEVARANYYARPDADPPMLVQAIKHALNGVVDPRTVEEKVDLVEPRSADQNEGERNGR